MKRLYFWCNIITPHWLHTLIELGNELGVEVHLYCDTLEELMERRILGWGEPSRFERLHYHQKKANLLLEVGSWEAGYHLITNPFNDWFNLRLIAVLGSARISYGLQQSTPGLCAGRLGKILRHFIYRPIFGRALFRAEYVLCHGTTCVDYFARLGVPRQRLFTSGYFVPSDGEVGCRGRRTSLAPLRAVYLGQYIERKQVLPLAEMLSRRCESDIVRFDFAGAGPQYSELVAAYAKGPGQVLPAVPHLKVIGFLRTYDVLVLPSIADEWAVVINEAILAGCAVIVTDKCGASQMVRHGCCGIVVKDAAGCVDALFEMARNPDMVLRWQQAALALSAVITPTAGAKYLAQVMRCASHGKVRAEPPWVIYPPLARIRLSLVYHFFAHYRLPIIRELAGHPGIELHCYGDRTSKRIDSTIRPITNTELANLNVTPVLKWGRWLWQRGLLSGLLRHKSDVYVFLASPYFISTWVAVLYLRLKGARVLFWGHLRYPHSDNRLIRMVRSFYYKQATGWLPYGHLGKRELVADGIAAHSIHVIYNSLDYRSHLALRNQSTSGFKLPWRSNTEPKPVFICVTRLVQKRRLDLLLRASAVLAQRGKNVRLLLVGEGSERAALQDLGRELGIEMLFYGACYDETRLRELYRGVVATVAPGEVGLTAIQSLSFGVPVITHGDLNNQMPEAEAIVDGRTGWFFAKGNVAALAEAMERALTANGDVIREQCYQIIDRFFNPEKQVQVITQASFNFPASESDWHLFFEGMTK